MKSKMHSKKAVADDITTMALYLFLLILGIMIASGLITGKFQEILGNIISYIRYGWLH